MDPLSELPCKQPPTLSGRHLTESPTADDVSARFDHSNESGAPATTESPRETPERVGARIRSSDCPWPGPPADLSVGVDKTEVLGTPPGLQHSVSR